MVKESVSSIKKRRKNTSSSENDAETDIYKKVLNFEEKEATQRSADSDAQIYFATCQDIKDLLADIYNLKMEKSDNKMVIKTKCMEACVKIAALKKLNRLEKYRTISVREALIVEKQKVDSTNLQYQNLLYEAAHLLSEFKKCKQFKSKDEEIELISPEKFLEEASESITKPFKNYNNLTDSVKHEMHLARLEYELEQRKKLAELCSTFEDEKKQLATDIVEKKNRLDGLGPRLAAVLEATKPLQEHLGLPIDKIQQEHKLATLLPDPLYLLYANTDAFNQVYNINMSVEILGDQEEAVQWKELQDTLLIADLESEQESEQPEVEEVIETKKRRHRKSTQVDPLEEKKKKLTDTHPLSVHIKIMLSDGPVLKIKYYYRPNLKIVTVTSSVDVPSKITGNAAKEVLVGESILNELSKDDFGTCSPNPSNQFQLQKVGLGSFHNLVPRLGYAYVWAQRICGLEFLTEETKKCENRISQSNIELVIKKIYARLKHRFALSEQLQHLEQNIFPALPKDVDCPYNIISSLAKWSSSTFQAFCQNASTEYLIENEVVTANDLYYCATITREKASLQAYIAIKNDYPKTVPIFSLVMKYGGVLSDSGNSDEIRDMERAVNVGWEDSKNCASWLLTAQLRHLCAYFDVYLETFAPDNFPQNMVFFRKVSGRNRRRPFNFRKIGAGIFT